MITILITISSVGYSIVMHLSPKLGSIGPQWGLVEIICMYVHLFVSPSVSISGCTRQFFIIFSMASNCVQRM